MSVTPTWRGRRVGRAGGGGAVWCASGCLYSNALCGVRTEASARRGVSGGARVGGTCGREEQTRSASSSAAPSCAGRSVSD